MLSYRWNDDLGGLMTNPYSNSAPVTEPDQYYGRLKELRNVVASIKGWEPLAITGEPRIGKSSFLYYLTHPEGMKKRKEFLIAVENPADYLFVLIELQLLPVRTVQGFWRYLFDRLVEEVKEEKIDTGSLQAIYSKSQQAGSDEYQIPMSFEGYIKDLKRKVLFLFDDFDILLNDFEDLDVIQVTGRLRALKALKLKDKLNYLIISTDPLTRLSEKKSIARNLSPLFNIITFAEPLGLLDKGAVDELLRKPLQQLSAKMLCFSEEEIDFINKLAGRHPDFLKISCSYLLEAKSHGPVNYETVWQSTQNDYRIQWLMNRLWERVEQDKPSLKETLLQVAQGRVPGYQSAFRELCQRGLVDNSVSPPQIFGELFREFVLYPEAHGAVPIGSIPLAAKLTPLESKLYNYLLAHAEQTCTREQLQEAIWGYKQPSSPDDALEQLVRRLRGKIESSSDQLLSVRGQGYLLRHLPAK